MKRLFYLAALALLAIIAVSCNKDDNKNGSLTNSGIIGSWVGLGDDYHYPRVTFKKDGTYEWHWDGIVKIKDIGTYTYEDGVVSMKVDKCWEQEENDGKTEWVTRELDITSDPDWFNGTRTCTITTVPDDVIFQMMVKRDYFVNEAEFLMLPDGASKSYKKSDLVGTWEMENEYENYRYVFGNDGSYIERSWSHEANGTLVASKRLGTWSVSGMTLTLSETDSYHSYKSLGYNPETQQNEYIYYPVDPVTLEAETWGSHYTYSNSYNYKIWISGKSLYWYMGKMEKK